jgi:hypothetical protein
MEFFRFFGQHHYVSCDTAKRSLDRLILAVVGCKPSTTYGCANYVGNLHTELCKPDQIRLGHFISQPYKVHTLQVQSSYDFKNRIQSYDRELQRQRCKKYKATGSLVHFEMKNILFYSEKPASYQGR